MVLTTFLLFWSSDLETESLWARRNRPGIWRLLEDSFLMIPLSWWLLRPLAEDALPLPQPLGPLLPILFTFSAERAALMTMLSKLTEDRVLFGGSYPFWAHKNFDSKMKEKMPLPQFCKGGVWNLYTFYILLELWVLKNTQQYVQLSSGLHLH